MMPPMDVLLFLAWRHVVARWRQAILLVTGVAVGVCILTTALSLTNGFEHDLVTKILGTSPHVSLSDPANTGVSAWKDWQSGVSRVAGVERVWPYVSGQALLVLGNRVSGVVLQGVPRERLHEDALYRQAIVEAPAAKDAMGHSGVLVGLELARLRGISRGDSIVLVTGLGFFSLVRLVVFGTERRLKARHRPKLPATEAALGFPREVARLNELVAVLVVGLLARGVVVLGQPKAALDSREFEAVLGFAVLPRAKSPQR